MLLDRGKALEKRIEGEVDEARLGPQPEGSAPAAGEALALDIDQAVAQDRGPAPLFLGRGGLDAALDRRGEALIGEFHPEPRDGALGRILRTQRGGGIDLLQIFEDDRRIGDEAVLMSDHRMGPLPQGPAGNSVPCRRTGTSTWLELKYLLSYAIISA